MHVLEYDLSDVNGQELKKIWIRGSSSKQKYDNKEKYICFMLHDGSMWSWSKGLYDEVDTDDEEEHMIK